MTSVRLPVVAAVSATTLILAAAPAVAQTEPSVEVTGDIDTCPAVQMVLVNGQFDSDAQAHGNSGFFGPIATKAMEANGGKLDDPSGGFAASETMTQTADASDSPSDDLWGSADSASSEVSTTTDSDDLWGSPAGSSTSSVEAEESATAEPSSTPAASSEVSSDEQSTDDGTAKPASSIARIYINFDDQGGYIPGVTGEEKKEYSQAVSAAVERTEDVLGEIHTKCGDTHVLLAGYSEGAQVANTVAKRIGAGKSAFPAKQVAGVALFSDPSRSENQPLVANGETTPAPVPETEGTNTTALGDAPVTSPAAPDGAGVATLTDQAGGNGATETGLFGALNNRVMSFCLPGDSTCAIPEGSPLRTLIATSAKNLDLNDPQGSLQAISDTLGPAVVLGGVETLADDLSFGPNGFQIARASSPDETMIGRMAAETQKDHSIETMAPRLIQAGLKLGGMALAAGVTFAKEVVTPANLAQIAAAGAADPLAAVPVVATKLAAAAMNVITPATATGLAARVFDEISAAGFGESDIAQIATESATWKTLGSGAYQNTPLTADGRSATDFTADWAQSILGDVTGADMSGLAGLGDTVGGLADLGGGFPAFDPSMISNAMSLIGV